MESQFSNFDIFTLLILGCCAFFAACLLIDLFIGWCLTLVHAFIKWCLTCFRIKSKN